VAEVTVDAPSPDDRRFYGLDVVRLVSFFAIATHHVSLVHYTTKTIEIAERSLVIRATEQVSRVLSFSGFTVCFLTSILTAYSGSSLAKRARLFAFLSVGWVVFSSLMNANDPSWLVWDVYPLIMVGVLTATLAEMAGAGVVRVLALLGYLMLWVEWWELGVGPALPSRLAIALGFADCMDGGIEWPVLPWIGLVWCGYGIGREIRVWRASAVARAAVSPGKRDVLQISRLEAGIWGALIVAGIPLLGSFYHINLGRFFSCEAYRQPPLTWWAHFLWPLALMRLSLDPRVNARLAKSRVCRWISGLAVSRKFWLAYILNYLLCYVVSWSLMTSGVEATEWNVFTIAMIAVFFLPLTELVTRGVLALWALIAALLRDPPPASAG
jgi:hypothetical protein